MDQISYTTINHLARIKLSLTANEYMVADLVYNLSNNPENETEWCYAKKETMGIMLGLSRESVHKIINKLLEKELVEKSPETAHLKTTAKWYKNVVIKKSDESSHDVNNVHSEESSHDVTKVHTESEESSHQESEESSHYKDNNNKDNNNYIINVRGKEKLLSDSTEGEIVSYLMDLFKAVNPSYESLFSHKAQRTSMEHLYHKHDFFILESLIKSLPNVIAKPYAPNITTPVQLEAKFGNLGIFLRQQQGMKKRGGIVRVHYAN